MTPKAQPVDAALVVQSQLNPSATPFQSQAVSAREKEHRMAEPGTQDPYVDDPDDISAMLDDALAERIATDPEYEYLRLKDRYDRAMERKRIYKKQIAQMQRRIVELKGSVDYAYTQLHDALTMANHLHQKIADLKEQVRLSQHARRPLRQRIQEFFA